MLKPEERLKLFQDEVAKLEKKFEMEIAAILTSRPNAIFAELTVIDKKPQKPFSGLEGVPVAKKN